MVALAEKLRSEYARTCNCTEYGDIEYEYELVDDGNAAHRLSAHTAHHDVIYETYEIGDEILQYHGYYHAENYPVERLVANEFFSESC